MTVRLGDVTFSDWISFKCEGGYTDTFIFHIDAMNGLPPFGYRPLLQRLVAELNQKRPGASLWIRVDSPGEWYVMEVKRSMTRGLSIPYVVTCMGEMPKYRSFSFRPRLFFSSPPHPPVIDDGLSRFSQEELKCLQVLTRIRKGREDEVASLTGLPEKITYAVLQGLQESGLVVHKLGKKIQKDKSKSKEMDPYPMWHSTRKGISIALRSWGAARSVDFSKVKELNPHLIGTQHRTISREWPAWLRSAYPRAEIWTGWSESKLPGIAVYPDALAWGKIQGCETLFWLEVGDNHKSREEIEKITSQRLKAAEKLCERTGVRSVYAQLSPQWVHDAMHWSIKKLSHEVAVILGRANKNGTLPMIEWGKITFLASG